MIRNFKHTLLLMILSLWGIPLGMSQTWLPMDKGIECLYPGTYVKNIIVDPVTDKLFVSGDFSEDGNCVSMRGLAQWNGQYWDSIGRGSEGNIPKLGMTMYKDTLYVTGSFYNSYINFCLAKWDGSHLDTLSNSPEGAWAFAEKNGILYMGGPFDFYTTDSTYMIKKYDGTRFRGEIPYCFTGGGGYVNALAFYRDTLYVAGYYDYAPCKTLGSLGKWDGTSLQLLSSAFANDGSHCYIETMVEYQGELYIGGYFLQSYGYAGNFIMKWNGSTFSPVGSGMNNRVRCMKVYNDKLYVGGDFTDAGGIASNYVAMWDGSRWNSITTDTFNIPGGALLSVYAMDVYHDSLIIGGSFTSINGDTACRKIAKYNAALAGIHENTIHTNCSIYPNPSTNQITIELSEAINQTTTIHIKNTLGQTIKTIPLIKGNKQQEIDISDLPAGFYFVQMQSGNWMISKKFIKQ